VSEFAVAFNGMFWLGRPLIAGMEVVAPEPSLVMTIVDLVVISEPSGRLLLSKLAVAIS